MMGKTTASMALSLAIALGLALPSTAEARRGDRHDDLAQLALRVERASYDVYCDAVNADLRRRPERRAVGDLRELNERAAEFRRTLSRRGAHHPDTRRAYRRLENAFDGARRTVPALYEARRVRRGFHELAGLAHRLDVSVAGFQPPRHDRVARGHHGARRDARVGRVLFGNDGWTFAWSVRR